MNTGDENDCVFGMAYDHLNKGKKIFGYYNNKYLETDFSIKRVINIPGTNGIGGTKMNGG